MSTVNRYCSFIGQRDCSFDPGTLAGNRVFAAYSSNGRILSIMRSLAQRGSQFDAEIVTWEQVSQSKGAGIIFCDVCRQIEASDVVFCEISDWNYNVVFELGYAIGRGKPIVLLKDSVHQTGFDFPMMDDMRYLSYRNVDDIVTQLVSMDWSGKDAQRLFDSVAHRHRSEDNVDCFYLKGGIATESANAIEKELRRTKWVKVQVDDPDNSFSHLWYDLSDKIALSDLVIAHLVSNDTRDAQRMNAKTALLAGLALATSKRLLVLQEKPADKMLDLKNVRKEYEGASQARSLAEVWLRNQAREQDEIRRNKRASILDETKQRALQILDFGQPAAENDANLLQHFIPMPATTQAAAGRRHFFIGRRGSGKSAACLYLEQELDIRPHDVVRLLRPVALQFASLRQTLLSHFGGESRPYIYTSMWRFVLYTELVEAVLNSTDKLNFAGVDKSIQQLEAFRDEHCDILSGDFDDRLRNALQQASHITGKVEGWDPKGQIIQTFHSQSINELEKALLPVIKEKRVFLVIDNLDQDWNGSDLGPCADVLIGLINEAQRINTAFGGKVNIIVFLRTDIADVVRRCDVEADKKLWSEIQWDKESLSNLIAVRISGSLGIPYDGNDPYQIWSRVFPPMIGEANTSCYIVDRTLMRPRDLIWYCSIILDLARMRGHESITQDDVVDAEKAYSRQITQMVLQEYAHALPDIESMMVCLINCSPILTGGEICALVKDAVDCHDDSELWAALDLLYRAGIIGIVRDKASTFWYSEQDFRRAIGGIQPPSMKTRTFISTISERWDQKITHRKRQPHPVHTQHFCIHPAFHQSLGVHTE